MSRMHKAFLLFTGLIIICAFYFGYYIFLSDRNTIKFIERVTSIKLPSRTKVVQLTDNGEFIVVGKFLLPIEDVPSFEKQNHFVPAIRKEELYFLSGRLFIDSANWPKPNDFKQVSHMSDCKRSNTWDFLINNETGELWVTVDYPDMAGDATPCDKK